ncbi:MAG: hypothetical protein CL853_08970 [Crocinitomicaceae bacterium]|nr:hypothetical protein [Crocinitomicaceae bacterium]|tara:strand:+ start:6998 stop:8257 length:1260 start_codon:yes stop_codon:yes gene_type:complete
MNKLSLIAVSLSMNLFYFGQSTIIFEEKSVQISNNVEIQALKLYSEINNGNELILNVLTKKENKKLSNQDKINYSKVRVKKLAAFYKDSIGIEAQNLLIQFKPFQNKRQSSNGHPLTGVTWTRENIKNITTRKGIYQLVVKKQEKRIATGYINDTINGVFKATYDSTYGAYLHGKYTSVYVPSGSYDCNCNELTIELKEFFSPSEILLAGLTTTSSDKMLMTGGMIYIMSYCDGKQVALKKGTRAEINFYTIYESFGIFFGKQKDGLIDWKLDNDIETILNPLEFNEETEEMGGLKVLTDKFGWINCDAFVNDKGPRTQLSVNMAEKVAGTTAFRLIFHDIKSVLPGYYTNNKRDHVLFSNLPTARNASLLVYQLIKGEKQIIWSISELETGVDQIVSNLNFKTTTIAEFKKITDKIWQ